VIGAVSTMVFLGSKQRQLFKQGVPILTYHKVGEAPSASIDPFLYVGPDGLESDLQSLVSAGFVIKSIDSLVGAGGEKVATEMEPQRAVITFDDGFENVFRNGLEILNRHRAISIQYLVARALGKLNAWDVAKGDVPEKLMDEVQVREWLSAGQLIGSHSLNHPNLRKISAAQAREEIFSSKAELEQQFGVKVRHFCYPYGSYDERIRDLVIEAGYESASTVEFGVNPAGASRFELRRIIPTSQGELIRKVSHRLGRRLKGPKVSS
jgi:peptidoglycan/xylan/chitin deacetylase (PgdA/CDA1 family)